MALVEVLSIVPKCEHIIDVEEEYSVVKWNENVTKKLKECAKVEGERNLDTLMKWYIETLKDNIPLKSMDIWKVFMMKHLKFFKSYLLELNCLYLDNYLSNMENILVCYVEVELKSLQEQPTNGTSFSKKKMNQMYSRITKLLYIYLLGREDHVLHVLMKIKYEISKETMAFMNLFYGKFLTKDPSNKSDLAFCRAYLLFEKWKKLRLAKSECKSDVEMELFLYSLYKRSPQEVKENLVLRKILYSNPSSILDALAFNEDEHENLMDRYFEFFSSGNIQEGELVSETLGIVQSEEDDSLNTEEEDEDFQKAYEYYTRSMAGETQTVIDTIEIPDEDDNDNGDCQIVEKIVLFLDVSDDEDSDDVIIIPTEQDTSFSDSTKVLPQKESEIVQIVEDDDLIVIEDNEPKTSKSAVPEIDPNKDLTQPPDKITCKSPDITNNLAIYPENNSAKECSKVVTTSQVNVKKLVTTETQTDFASQTDGVPTASNEGPNNDDPVTIETNTPVVSTPSKPAPTIDNDKDIAKNDLCPQSPTSSHIENSNREFPAEVTHNASQNSGDDSGVSTSESTIAIDEKNNNEDDNDHLQKNMSPDSSEDAAKSAQLKVKVEKVMYTSPRMLKKNQASLDWASIIGGSTDDDSPFSGQVDGRLNRSDDKYNGIAENFNLYEASLPDDSLSDNNVSSSNNIIESSEDPEKSESREEDKGENKTEKVDGDVEVPSNEHANKKRVCLVEEVTLSDHNVPRSSPEHHNGVRKGILKPPPEEFKTIQPRDIQLYERRLYVKVEKLSMEKMEELVMLNEISRQITSKTFPNFSCEMFDLRQSKGRQRNDNTRTKSVSFKNWRNSNDFIEEESIFTNGRSPKKENKYMQEGLNSNELLYTDKKSGKRKRQNKVSSGLPPIQASDYRESTENEAIERSSRGRKKFKKDYNSLFSAGISRKSNHVD